MLTDAPALTPSGQLAGLQCPTHWKLSGHASCFSHEEIAQKEASGERKRVCLAGVGARVWGTQQVLTH